MENKETNQEDCTSCRLIGGTSLLLCSAYVFSRGLRAKTIHNKITSFLFGSSLGYTGIARLLNIFPFDIKAEIKTDK